MKIPRLCLHLLLIVSGGTAAFFVSYGAFVFATETLLHTETEPLRRASLEGTVGSPFAALSALVSAYLISRMLKVGGSAERPSR